MNNLTPSQVYFLKLIYKFRFVSAPLLSELKHVSTAAIKKSLAVLVAKQYLARNYDKNYKLQGKAASYYLTPLALRVLRQVPECSNKVLHSMYKNKSVSQAFIDEHLTVMSVYIALKRAYPGAAIYSRYEIADHQYFPDQPPSLYMHGMRHYFVYLTSDTPLFILKKQFTDLLEHYESGDWESATKQPYPNVLYVCSSVKSEKRIQQFMNNALENAGIEELTALTTTTHALQLHKPEHPRIWSYVNDPELTMELP